MADQETLEIILQELKDKVTSFDEKKQVQIRDIASKFGWEWNKDHEEGYEETTEDKIKFLEYGLNFIEEGKRILVVGDKSIEAALKHLLLEYNHTIAGYSTKAGGNEALTRSHFNAVVCGRKHGLHNKEEESFPSNVKRNNNHISTILFLGKDEEIEGDTRAIDAILKNPLYDSDDEVDEKITQEIIDQINKYIIIRDVLDEKLEIESKKSNIYRKHPEINYQEHKKIFWTNEDELSSRLSPKLVFQGPKPEIVYNSSERFPGVASGKIYSNFKKALRTMARGQKVIMYIDDLNNLNIEQIKTLKRVEGIVFNRYSDRSHHVIDLLSSGIPIMQAENTSDDEKTLKFGDFTIKESGSISFDGIMGEMYKGEYNTRPSGIPFSDIQDPTQNGKLMADEFNTLMKQCNEIRESRIELMINADDVKTIEASRKYGICESVGLVRSENIIKQKQANIDTFGAYLLALLMDGDENKIHGKKSLRSRKRQSFRGRQDTAFYNILKYQEGRRTQIRLLDAPLNEFFDEETIDALTKKHPQVKKEYAQKLKDIVKDPNTEREWRGVVLAERYQQIYELQIDALFGAYKRACKDLKKENKPEPDLKIFIPFVSHIDHVTMVQEMAERINNEKYEGKIKYDLGVTLETPGALWSAHKMLEAGIRYFTFGTNDLFPLIENANRNTQRSAYVEKDGNLIMNPAIQEAMRSCLQMMAATGIPRDQYEVGISGEMNPIKLNNLEEIIPALDYVSASRPVQAAVLNLKLAKMIVKKYIPAEDK